MLMGLIGIGRHSSRLIFYMPMPLLVRLCLLSIIVAFSFLCIRQFGVYMRRRYYGHTPW